MEDVKIRIGQNIKMIRQYVFDGCLQAEFAEKLNVLLEKKVSTATVSNWEKGKIEPSISKLRCISKISNVSLDEIIEISLDETYLKKKKELNQDILLNYKNKEILALLKNSEFSTNIIRLADLLKT